VDDAGDRHRHHSAGLDGSMIWLLNATQRDTLATVIFVAVLTVMLVALLSFLAA
jgi:hypothetical protein